MMGLNLNSMDKILIFLLISGKTTDQMAFISRLSSQTKLDT